MGRRARKSLGQNFLSDGNVRRKIVDRAVAFGPPYFEVGPGLGALTDLIAATGEPLTAVEADRELAARLKSRYLESGTPVEVIEGDVLEFDDADLAARFAGGATFVGNLPYNLSSPILIWLFARRRIFPRAVIMLQKELVDRLSASMPGTKAYGTLSVYLAVLGEVVDRFEVTRHCFTPAPKVDSAVISLRLRDDITDVTYDWLRRIVRTAFGHRRKTLRNADVSNFPNGREGWEGLLASGGIPLSARAEELTPATYLDLAKRLPAD